jgi:hypothetical protein
MVGVKHLLDVHDETTFLTEYEIVRKNPPIGRAPVTLFAPHRSRDDDSFCLLTNRDVAIEFAEPLAETYRC